MAVKVVSFNSCRAFRILCLLHDCWNGQAMIVGRPVLAGATGVSYWSSRALPGLAPVRDIRGGQL